MTITKSIDVKINNLRFKLFKMGCCVTKTSQKFFHCKQIQKCIDQSIWFKKYSLLILNIYNSMKLLLAVFSCDDSNAAIFNYFFFFVSLCFNIRSICLTFYSKKKSGKNVTFNTGRTISHSMHSYYVISHTAMN